MIKKTGSGTTLSPSAIGLALSSDRPKGHSQTPCLIYTKGNPLSTLFHFFLEKEVTMSLARVIANLKKWIFAFFPTSVAWKVLPTLYHT